MGFLVSHERSKYGCRAMDIWRGYESTSEWSWFRNTEKMGGYIRATLSRGYIESIPWIYLLCFYNTKKFHTSCAAREREQEFNLIFTSRAKDNEGDGWIAHDCINSTVLHEPLYRQTSTFPAGLLSFTSHSSPYTTQIYSKFPQHRPTISSHLYEDRQRFRE